MASSKSERRSSPVPSNGVNDGKSRAQANGSIVVRRTALILYGSETGNAQDLAEELGRLTTRLRFATTVLDLDSITLRDLLKYTVVIFSISTTGQGDFPQNARGFWKTLLSGALKPGSLRKLRFTAFGLGDSSYAKYNVVCRMLCGRLLQLGAREFFARGEGNEQHPEGHVAGFREWHVGLKTELCSQYPLLDGVEPIGDDEFLEPEWKLALSDVPAAALGPSRLPTDVPSLTAIPVKSAHQATLVSNTRLTTETHFQDVRLLDLRLPPGLAYLPGAVAVIYPKNFPEDIQNVIDLMGWDSIADEPVELVGDNDSRSQPSPLRTLDLEHVQLTLRWLLENIVDFMSIPRRSFFSLLLAYGTPATGASKGDITYQHDRLRELADPNLIDELWDYTTRPKRTILEVLSDFTAIKIPLEYLLTILPTMRGRQFSIASAYQSNDTETKIELLIAIADPPSPIIKYRRRYGVCTRYISVLQPGLQVSVVLHPGYLDPKPKDLGVPDFMIAPGTGVAPMRALIQQRLKWSLNQGLTHGSELASDVLLFGSRSPTADFFFADEWRALQEEHGLTVWTAFSRAKEEGYPRQYVQDLLEQNVDTVRQMILEKGGKVYLCGSAGAMPRAVRAMMDEILGAGMVEKMEREGRWLEEVW